MDSNYLQRVEELYVQYIRTYDLDSAPLAQPCADVLNDQNMYARAWILNNPNINVKATTAKEGIPSPPVVGENY